MKFKDFKYQVSEATESEKDEDMLSDEEIDKLVDDLEWEDIDDMYPEKEEDLEAHLSKIHDGEKQDVKEEVLDEKLSVQSRMRKKMSMIRFKAKNTLARRMKTSRSATFEVIQNRARVAARRALYKKFLRGRDKSQLSAAEKDRVEGQVARLKSVQAILATKMISKIRKIEQKRLSRIRSKKR